MMKVDPRPVHGKPSEADQHMMEAMSELVLESFKIILSELSSQGNLDHQMDKAKKLTPMSAIIGTYMGLLRVASLDGSIDPSEAKLYLDKSLMDLIKNSRLAKKGEDIDKIVEDLKRSMENQGEPSNDDNPENKTIN